MGVGVINEVGEGGNVVAVGGTGVADAGKTVGEDGIGVVEALIGVGDGKVGVGDGLARIGVVVITTSVAVGLLITGGVTPCSLGLAGVRVGSAKVGMMINGCGGGAALFDNPETIK